MEDKNICPCCGQPRLDPSVKCSVQGCSNEAIWEGWYKVKDPILGKPSGLIQKRHVCDVHQHLLEGANND